MSRWGEVVQTEHQHSAGQHERVVLQHRRWIDGPGYRTSFCQLRELAERGTITSDSEVRHEKFTRGKWVSATRIKELNSAFMAAAEVVPPPTPDVQIVETKTAIPREAQNVLILCSCVLAALLFVAMSIGIVFSFSESGLESALEYIQSIIFLMAIVAVVAVAIYASQRAEKEKARLAKKRKRELAILRNKFDELIDAIATNPNDEETRTSLLCLVRERPDEFSQITYEVCLGLLPQHPQLKPFALELGRLSYGHPREKGVPTIYDEQAIQNDILAHSG